jgi:hypothetical protein
MDGSSAVHRLVLVCAVLFEGVRRLYNGDARRRCVKLKEKSGI